MRGKLYFLNVSINYYYYFRSRLHYKRVKKRTFILMGSSELKWGSNTHLKRLSCRKSQKKEKMGSSEESVYLTMVFSNKMMKGLLIVLSVSVRLSVFVLR